jgi:chromosome segregation ATPase
MSNRVDELEGQLAELRAAVNGLTEELVETKDRVRELEAEAASEEPTASTVERETPTKSDDHVVVVEQEQDDVDVATSSVTDDAEPDTEPIGEAVETEETIKETSNESTDDIIVA